ncbi:MAG: DUF2867 domain-containing protein, partial [Akkermansiaceae bacterium]
LADLPLSCHSVPGAYGRIDCAIKELPDGSQSLRQTATFRPQGLLGRLYWYVCLPFHWLLFPRMARKLAGKSC